MPIRSDSRSLRHAIETHSDRRLAMPLPPLPPLPPSRPGGFVRPFQIAGGILIGWILRSRHSNGQVLREP